MSIRRRLPNHLEPYIDRIKDLTPMQLDKMFNFHRGEWKETEDGGYFTGVARITTLEEALEFADVDLNIWEVDRYLFNKWEVGAKDAEKKIQIHPLYQVKIWFKKKAMNEAKVIASLMDRYKDYQPPLFEFEEHEPTTGNLGIINMYDAHLDKISLKAETGTDSTLEGNIQTYKKAFEKILSGVANYGVDKILIPIGNDLFHTNDTTGKTKKGTQIQYLCSPEEAYEKIVEVTIECILKAAQIAPIRIIPMKGNHDEDKVNVLIFWLYKMFENSDRVNVTNNRLQRNYIQFGKCMFGFAHGDKEKKKISQLPLFMAEEQPQMWANTKWRKFYCGDLHHNFEYQFLKKKDQPGASVEFLRSVGQSDQWHSDHGWIGVPKTAEASIWHKEEGEKIVLKMNV